VGDSPDGVFGADAGPRSRGNSDHPGNSFGIKAGMSKQTTVNHHEEMAVETRRLTAPEIFDAAVASAREELRRSSRTLAFSGLAGGLTMGLTGLSVAAVRAILGGGAWEELASYLVYPMGFIAVIIGRSQLFTENTLYPVVLLLDERKQFSKHARHTLRLWATVFAANVVGALCFAALAVKTGALSAEISSQLIRLGSESVTGTPTHIFWSAVIGGWLIALVAWMVTASQWTIGQLAMIWLLTFIVGIGKLSHCIATSGEILAAVLAGSTTLTSYLHWLLLATSGNIAGGVVMVSVLNYGQVRDA
jgi:formate-nitrite transporter family protein